MHKWVTHNQHYDTYEEFTEAITEFLETTLPENWKQFLDTITDNFRVISPKQYKIIQANKRMPRFQSKVRHPALNPVRA